MKSTATLVLALAALGAGAAQAAPRGFTANDLVNLDRVSDPQVSPGGRYVAFQLRETNFEANKGVNGIWLQRLDGKSAAVKVSANGVSSATPRWSPDGRALYYTAPKEGQNHLWRVDVAPALTGGERKKGAVMGDSFDAKPQQPVPVSEGLPLDIGSFKLSPDGKQVLISLEVYTDCADLDCTRKRLDDTAASKVTGKVYDNLFVRHWDTWADGRRNQLYLATLRDDGLLDRKLKLISRGIDGDVPSKPFGDDSEYAFSPDGKTVYFGARIAGKTEAWSTNFDLYSVSTEGKATPKNLTPGNQAWDSYPLPSHDGKTLYYLAMKRPTFEADRFGVMALDLATGQSREINAGWDRSAGSIKLSPDGKTIYATADDNGNHPLFAIDAATGKARDVTGPGHVEGYDVAGNALVFARDTLKWPAELFMAGAGGKAKQITHYNADKLKDVAFGNWEFFDFKGAGDERVQGYVVKPWNYEKGKKYPVAFIIHGGPQGAMGDDFHYRWNPQTYTGQGFAVVTVNFHGSTGYGQAFTDAISGDWGGRPLEDLQKGWAAALAKYDYLDGNRACALGASYGGYMINWIAGNWPQPWKCLVSHDGVFDARMMGYSTEELWFDEWEHGGTPYEKPESYEKFNPVNHVAKWKVPMLVVQGGMDFRIPLEQGLGAFTALQRRGIESQFLYFPDENHWVLKPQNSVKWHETVNAWLKKYAGQ